MTKPKIAERELWAVASTVLQNEGDDVAAFLLERVQTLMESGDNDGVSTWLAIADRVRQLVSGPKQIDGLN